MLTCASHIVIVHSTWEEVDDGDPVVTRCRYLEHVREDVGTWQNSTSKDEESDEGVPGRGWQW